MSFTLLPAVDVAGGRAVRLVRGEVGTETTHGSARDAALAWQAGGATWIHLVDLDAAFDRDSNAEVLAAVIDELDIDVELSAGICDDASLAWALSTGCTRVILSTAALGDLPWCARVLAAHGERIAVGLDVHVTEDANGAVTHRLAPRGAARDVGELWTTLARLTDDGCGRFVVTDVNRDGMMAGPNVGLYQAVTHATDAAVIASGGIAAIADLIALTELAAGTSLEGAIVGQALYAGRFTLPEALDAVRRAG